MNELRLTNFGFELDPVDVIVRSHWQSPPRTNFYLVYRWIFAVCAVTMFTYSMLTFGIHFYFVYLTRWGMVMYMTVGVYGAILVTIWHYNTEFRENVLGKCKMPMVFKIYWLCHNVALAVSCTISLTYWTMVHTDKDPVNAINIVSHVCNSVIMVLDFLIVTHPLRLYHAIYPMCFGLLYGLFTYIYFLCGGVNEMGEPFLYEVLDWKKPGKTTIVLLMTTLASGIIHVLFFLVYQARVCIRRKLCDRIVLPIQIEKDDN